MTSMWPIYVIVVATVTTSVDGQDNPVSENTAATRGSAHVVGTQGAAYAIDIQGFTHAVDIQGAANAVGIQGAAHAIGTQESVHAIEDPMFADNECRKAMCTFPSLCYIPHPIDCFKFIVCKPLETGEIISQVMQCAFGTKWKRGMVTSCDSYDLVDCPMDECKKPAVAAYFHQDNNCRTYWKCVNGQSRPACCPKYHSFNPMRRTCEPDLTCDSICPLLNDATCSANGQLYANFHDENCLTYWNCNNGHPFPECCPTGQAFNAITSVCVPDTSCVNSCPKEYSESCLKSRSLSYDLVDRNCRTYIKCNEKGQSNPYCCLPGQMYNVHARKCINGVGSKCIFANCPIGYLEDCRLEPVPGRGNYYKHLDAFGGIEMPCPVGTLFNVSGCQCSEDISSRKPTQTSPVCTMAIEAVFPDLKNLGSAVAALLMIGEYGQGETGVGNMINFWDGGAGINIPYYGSQSLGDMYLETRFRPTAASHNKQVFVSSCHYIDGVPTFEVSIDQFQGNGGMIKVLVKTADVPGLAEIAFPYKFDDELMFRVIYDGSQIGVFLDSNDPTMSNSAVRPLSGNIQIDRSGLRFAHCRYESNVSGFIGYVSEIKFSKCLTIEMQEALNAASPGTVG